MKKKTQNNIKDIREAIEWMEFMLPYMEGDGAEHHYRVALEALKRQQTDRDLLEIKETIDKYEIPMMVVKYNLAYLGFCLNEMERKLIYGDSDKEPVGIIGSIKESADESND